MTQTFDVAAVAYERWKRSVDMLLREAIRRRAGRAAAGERTREQRRARNLRRIVRRALSEYSRLQIAKQG